MDSNAEAAAALAAMQESRERLALAVDCPPERHLAFAALMGGLVASQAAPQPFVFVLEGLLLVGVALVIAWDRRRTGMFVNGYRAGRTLYVTLATLAFTLTVLGLTLWLKLDRGIGWAPLAGGALTMLIAYPASMTWQRLYLRELRRTP